MTEKTQINSSKNNELKGVLGSNKPANHKKGKNYFLLSNEEYNKVFKSLSQKYPKLFIEDKVLLFKTGIHKDIFDAADLVFSKSVIRKFLRLYTTKPQYKELHKENTSRYDLEGNEVGVVTKEDMESLKKQREEIKKTIAAKKLKKQELKNKNCKIENNHAHKDEKKTTQSNRNNDPKIKKLEGNQDKLRNIKSSNSIKPKLGLKA